MHNDIEDFEEDLGPSKSSRKRDMHALQLIGTRLTELSDSQLKKIPIENESLLEAILLARKIKAHGGRRRQLQFIGKLMRNIDSQPIIDGLAELDGQHQASSARLHRLENIRDELLSKGDEYIEATMNFFPDAERNQLRQLIRQHQREVAAEKASSAPRKLFRYLRELDNAQRDTDKE
ncbi:DUF615 domain-containing protein [Flavobacteriaceae bacterium]|nr:DUF615 domain-containing protein [Flavobacteriaceae bacterium]|tara:strand:+ start:34 stop:567 length:534 start_codon:yes stop_codon:yes gene_type:complete